MRMILSLFPMPAAALAAGLLLGTGSAQGLDMSTPEGQLQAMRRIQCAEEDGRPVTYWWNGEMWSRVPGEPDRLLFLVEGMNIRQCGPAAEPRGPNDFRMVSREVLLYKDPVTGEVLDAWENPWTGETVEVLHITNDPVNFSFSSVGRDGRPVEQRLNIVGNHWWLTSTVPLFYRNPLGGDFQEAVGGVYHATEMFNFFGDMDNLTSRRTRTAEVRIGWVRVSGWLPWMKMGDRVGILYFHTAGRKLDRYEDMSDVMKRVIAERFPDYSSPPPLDDDRPNETSWTFFKRVMEERYAQ
ncbi:MAG: DUF1838 domain-containing protein [Chromatiales bacterium]|nr:DUF1838 domain-containing protein [Chromatiales bacterium]